MRKNTIFTTSNKHCMESDEPVPVCPYCGNHIAVAIHTDQALFPWYNVVQGESFYNWKYSDCQCEKAKQRRKEKRKLSKQSKLLL